MPADERPPVNLVRITFQVMVGIGFFLAFLGAVHLYRLARLAASRPRRGSSAR